MMDGAGFHDLRALLDWQVELGADEAILDAPLDRYALAPPPEAAPSAAASGAAPAAVAPIPPPPEIDPAAEARAMAARAPDLAALETALAAFPHCDLRKGANTIFAQGEPTARVMVIGEAPDYDENRAGHPFAGAAGTLFDAMFAAIGLARDGTTAETALYLAPAFPWRPPADRAPDPAEIALALPFLERHVALVQPDVLVLMGALPCEALLGRGGIRRMRGTWAEALGRPVLPMVHPRWLLERPEAKREAWADLLSLKRKLEG